MAKKVSKTGKVYYTSNKPKGGSSTAGRKTVTKVSKVTGKKYYYTPYKNLSEAQKGKRRAAAKRRRVAGRSSIW